MSKKQHKEKNRNALRFHEDDASYYEYTAIKAAKDTLHDTPLEAGNAAPKAASGGNGKA